MSTNSTISILNEDGTVSSIYCHWDGYFAYNGRMLLQFYKDVEEVKELISLGSLSALCPLINPTGDTHSFGTPEDNVTIAYHRDRGEDLVIDNYSNLYHYERCNKSGYNYLFKDGNWYSVLNKKYTLINEGFLEIHKD